MSRKARENFENIYCHIMVQGLNKSYIFNKKNYKIKYIEYLNQYYKDYNISIISYCIMDNHAHLLLYSYNMKQISLFMHKVNCIFGILYNKSEKRKGYVFNDRFKSQYILNNEYLIKCIKYIHMNPVKAGIVMKESEYEFSSYNEYFNKKQIIDWNKITEIISDEDLRYIIFENEENDIEIMDINNNKENFRKSVDIFLKRERVTKEDIKKDYFLLYKYVNELRQKDYLQKEIANSIDINPSRLCIILKRIKENFENRP